VPNIFQTLFANHRTGWSHFLLQTFCFCVDTLTSFLSFLSLFLYHLDCSLLFSTNNGQPTKTMEIITADRFISRYLQLATCLSFSFWFHSIFVHHDFLLPYIWTLPNNGIECRRLCYFVNSIYHVVKTDHFCTFVSLSLLTLSFL
jgi:hypothetical protein